MVSGCAAATDRTPAARYPAQVLPTEGPLARLLDVAREVLSQETRDRWGAVYDRMVARKNAAPSAGSRSSSADLLTARALALVREELAELTAELRSRAADSPRSDPVEPDGSSLAVRGPRLDAALAALLNYAQGPSGYAARAGLWFSPPVSVAYAAEGVGIDSVNERIVEQPFAYRALAMVPPGARVLDVGGSESLVAYGLASLGYEVTVCDPRGYPLQHPRLTVASQPVGQVEAEPFAAVICLSSIGHICPRSDELEERHDGDRQAILAIRRLLERDGLLVLTVPFGRRSVDRFQRVYDRAALSALLEGFDVVELRHFRAGSDPGWHHEPAPEQLEIAGHVVACVVARRRSGG